MRKSALLLPIQALAGIGCLTAVALILTGCARSPAPSGNSLTVAAAANLIGVMDEIAREFEEQTTIRVVVSYGSTAQLAQQIEHGGPFDVFAAADTEHVDALIEKGKLRRESRAIYARGQLVLWCPDSSFHVERIEDITNPAIRFISVAKPDLAPYGRATVEALKAVGIWDRVQPRITYANSISMAKQHASSGNADVAFTALSLVLEERGTVLKVDPRLYRPIDQALAITAATERVEAGRRLVGFVLGARGRALFSNRGYLLP
jgi:molybdate transport system substrate-binding protein